MGCGISSGDYAAAPVEYGDMPRSDQPHTTHGIASKGGKGEFQNQDAPLAAPRLGGIPNAHLYAVFDGHGQAGKEVSNFLKASFPNVLLSDSNFPRKPPLALRNASLAVNEKLRSSGIDAVHSGGAALLS